MEKTRNIQAEVYLLLQKYFFSGNEIGTKTVDEFRKELDSFAIDEYQILRWYISYVEQVFIGEKAMFYAPDPVIPANKKMTDWALEVYLNAFGDIIEKLFESRQGYEVDGIKKQDYIAFLCGINHNIYGSDYKIWENYHNMAESGEPILITGDTGTGKELHAKLFHYLSLRKKEQLFTLNCSGIPESLLESQLFGHIKGAFTGAIQKSDGILQSVGKGTLFLDEIGDMSMNLQAKILRVLEAGDYYRVGEYKKPLHFQGRIIAATNKNLESEILMKNFRRDLYYRIGVFHVKLPSFSSLPTELRRRKINYMLNQLVNRYAIVDKALKEKELHREGPVIVGSTKNYTLGKFITEDAEALLLEYNYPGNYRELSNILKSSLLNSGGSITVDYLPESVKKYRPTEGDQSASAVNDPLNVEEVTLKDIISHADRVKRAIVEKKIRGIYKTGKDIKNALRSEGVTNDSDYVKTYAKFTRILGKDRLKLLRNASKEIKNPASFH